MDYQRWEERENCGHAHRTIEAAEACKGRLTKRNKRGECSARWYNATIHNQSGERA